MTPARPRPRAGALAALAAGLLAAAAPARAQEDRKPSAAASLLPGASSRDPVSVDAGRLDYFDKEQKLVYTGDVVAKQGQSMLRASVLTIFLSRDGKETAAAPAPGAPGSSISRMEARGPVTVVNQDQVGTGDNGSYDKVQNRIILSGNVTLSQATNVIKGDKLVYDMGTGQAQVSSGQTLGRVRSVFTPGSAGPAGETAVKKPKRATAPAATGKAASGAAPTP